MVQARLEKGAKTGHGNSAFILISAQVHDSVGMKASSDFNFFKV